MDDRTPTILAGARSRFAPWADPAARPLVRFEAVSKRFGEVPAAVYMAEEGTTLDPETLRAFVAREIAPFKVPAVFCQVHEPLPRLGTEKVDKRSLRTRYTAQWEREQIG